MSRGIQDIASALDIGSIQLRGIGRAQPIVRGNVEQAVASLGGALQRLNISEIAFLHVDGETFQVAPIRAFARQHAHLPLRRQQRSGNRRADKSGRTRYQRSHAR